MAINILNKTGLEHFWDNLKKAFIWKPEERVLNGYLKLTSTGVVWETLPTMLRYKGSCTWAELPDALSITPPAEGDVWTVSDRENDEYFYKYYDEYHTYDWEPLGGAMANYLKKLKAGDLIKLEPGTGSDAGKEVISVDIPTEINKLLYSNGSKFTAEELMCKYQNDDTLYPVVVAEAFEEISSTANLLTLPEQTIIIYLAANPISCYKITIINNARAATPITGAVFSTYFPGSRLSYNPATKKLFYSDGTSIIKISNDYELPIASASTLGGVKVGTGLTINSLTGELSADAYNLPIASHSQLGGIKVGSTFTISTDGTLGIGFATSSHAGIVAIGPGLTVTTNGIAKLDKATTSSLGGIKVGSGLSIDPDGVLSANVPSLPTATTSTPGIVLIGSGLNITNGVLSATTYTLPTASSSLLGGIKVGNGVKIDNGVLSVKPETNGNVTVTSNGVNVPLFTSAVNGVVNKPTANTSVFKRSFLNANNQWGTSLDTGDHASDTGYLVKGIGNDVDDTKYLRSDGLWKTPQDTTYLPLTNMLHSSSNKYVVKGIGDDVDNTKYLRSDGSWQTPTNTTYTTLSSSAHASGTGYVVNGIGTVNTAAFLRSDGSWEVPPLGFGTNHGVEITTYNGIKYVRAALDNYTESTRQINHPQIDDSNLLPVILDKNGKLCVEVPDGELTININNEDHTYNPISNTTIDIPTTASFKSISLVLPHAKDPNNPSLNLLDQSLMIDSAARYEDNDWNVSTLININRSTYGDIIVLNTEYNQYSENGFVESVGICFSGYAAGSMIVLMIPNTGKNAANENYYFLSKCNKSGNYTSAYTNSSNTRTTYTFDSFSSGQGLWKWLAVADGHNSDVPSRNFCGASLASQYQIHANDVTVGTSNKVYIIYINSAASTTLTCGIECWRAINI